MRLPELLAKLPTKLIVQYTARATPPEHNPAAHRIAKMRDIDPLITGRGAGLVAKAGEVSAATVKPSDGRRVGAWVSMGVPSARVEQAAQAGVPRRLAAGGSR